jgi:hypothetical protein
MKLSALVAGTGLTPSLRSVVGPFGVALQAKPIAPQCGYFCGSKNLSASLIDWIDSQTKSLLVGPFGVALQ